MHARARIRRPSPRFAGLAIGLAAAFALSACQQIEYGEDDEDEDWERPDFPWWEEAGEDDPPNNSSSSSAGSSSSGSSGSTTTGTPKLDLPPGDIPAVPCTTVDLLFVIDNSNSMLDEQANLIASFDGFIAGIQDNLDEANDYHIGVVTTDDYVANDPECQELGALVTQTFEGSCGPFAEGAFITLADELEGSFTCAANVGVDGSNDERPIDAMLTALSPELNAEGGCNAGFLRDDALLVVVLITDEDDGVIFGQGSAGDPGDWFGELVGLKGFESNVVVLALAGVPPPNNCSFNDPLEGADVAWRITDFVERFSYGRLGDVCADDYAGFFDDSLDIIDMACTNFMPEG